MTKTIAYPALTAHPHAVIQSDSLLVSRNLSIVCGWKRQDFLNFWVHNSSTSSVNRMDRHGGVGLGGLAPLEILISPQNQNYSKGY